MKPCPRPALRLTQLSLAALMAGTAAAETSPYHLGVVQSLGHESNLYRIGDNQTLPAGTSKSDNVSATSLIGGRVWLSPIRYRLDSWPSDCTTPR